MVPRHSLAGLLLLGAVHSASASEPRQIIWADLVPGDAVEIENPFEALSMDQMEALRNILRLDARAQGGNDPDAAEEAEDLRRKLAEDGLDADALFAKRLEIIELRQAAASATNEDLIGDQIRMPGYLLPLDIKDKKAVEFLLVPTVGACIHTPPPPANQLVHVQYEEGVEVTRLYMPVWITGELQATQSTQTVNYYDGEARVDVSYAMKPLSVEPYR